MSEWNVLPIFIIQFLALGLLLFPRNTYVFGLRLKIIILVLLFIACIGMGISLYHHCTVNLHLYF